MKKMTLAEHEAEKLMQDLDLKIPFDFKQVCPMLSTNSLKIEYHERPIETQNICGMSIVNNKGVTLV